MSQRRWISGRNADAQGKQKTPGSRSCRALNPVARIQDYFETGSGRTWNFTSLLVLPLPPSAWNGARVA